MTDTQDIRWIQRLGNYDKAVVRLQNAAKIISSEKQFSGEVDDLLLPYEFDFCIYHDLKDMEFKDHIDRRGIVIYSSATKKGCQ